MFDIERDVYSGNKKAAEHEAITLSGSPDRFMEPK